MESSLSIFGTGFQDPALNQAQQIMYEAWEEQNPVRRIMLARQALSISPDCADAYVLLAEEEADTVGRALEYYQKGVEAGERALGKDYFEQDVGYFWGLLETRPYMRAREGLARTLVQLKRYDEAIAHYRDMLRLNPGDNQGIRYSLLNLLTSLGRDDEAWALLNQYDDGMAEWLYTQALLTFRREGPTQKAAAALRRAIKMNPHVPAYLTGRKRIPRQLPPYISLGEDTEAMYYASGYLPIWRKTPGALDWLKQHTNQQKKTKGRKRKR
ncbi:MAG: tetratricopeptide repeat protein [Chloroflexi bacterium]|nr:MAG: tetratricopeptide repeat protein [Chloroflexota bacterium]